jgi:acyl-CoA thioesterase FadM
LECATWSFLAFAFGASAKRAAAPQVVFVIVKSQCAYRVKFEFGAQIFQATISAMKRNATIAE